jgi:alpha-D-xyloside xylohydrolase
VPWLFDEEAVDVLRFFTRLKCRLMPYLFGTAVQAHTAGVPVMRAMLLEFPDDPACDYLDRQYMLGDSLLVAPVFTPDGLVDYYLPAGRWTNFLTGQVIAGGRWLRERHDYLSLPLMVRPNTVIPIGANEQRPDYDYADGVILHVFELQDGAAVTVRVPTLSGDTAATFEVKRDGQRIDARAEGASEPWRVLLRGVASLQSVEAGVDAAGDLGMLLTPERGASLVSVTVNPD